MKYDIVKFKDGKFGLRRRNWIDRLFNLQGSFKDFKPVLRQWRKPIDIYFTDCELESEEDVKQWLQRVKNDFVDQ